MIFLDSNVPIYAAEVADPAKHAVARAILGRAVRREGFLISAQVLNEFANVALKKLRRSLSEVQGFVAVLRRIDSIDLSADWTSRALDIKARYGIQFYDALIVVAAKVGNCTEIWSEDLADGQVYDGVRVRNPFSAIAG